jgi:hypothetical protein
MLAMNIPGAVFRPLSWEKCTATDPRRGDEYRIFIASGCPFARAVVHDIARLQ